MVALNRYHVFDRYELSMSDLRMYWHSTPKTTGAIKIAAIDDKSIAELGQWPFRRSVMAQFERALTDYKVAVVGYDVLFSEPDNFDAARASLVERLEKSGTTKVHRGRAARREQRSGLRQCDQGAGQDGPRLFVRHAQRQREDPGA